MAEEGKEELLLARRRYEHLISSLPASKGLGANPLRKYNGYWFPEQMLPGVMAFSEHFQLLDTDIILISPPKCGTTWLMALAFATITRKNNNPFAPDHPLLHTNPHDIVLYAELMFLLHGNFHKLDHLASPRLFVTHIPYELLPKSVTSSKCRVVYICRDPKDTLVSAWHFFNSAVLQGEEPTPLGEAFEAFYDGKFAYGPIWDHCLGYWRESLKRPNKVLFLKYEEMKEDPVVNLKKLAGFVGCPFSEEDVSKGVPEKIIELCSFQKLSSIEKNSDGGRIISNHVVKYSYFFRKGQVGDWKNYLTAQMAQKLDHITEEKLHGSGLTFGKPKAV